MSKHPEGIASLKTNPPVGAHVTLGRKQASGGVVEKDQFHFVSPFEGEGKVKPYLPQFNEYHRLQPQHRRLIRANLVFGSIQQNFTNRMRMVEFPKHWPAPRARPKHIPVCEGDGERAIRWQQKDDETKEIRCPDEQCEFRQVDPPLCKPYSSFLFQPRWEKMDLPSPLCRMTSPTGWSSAANIAGFFKHLQDQANQLGLPDATWYGFPFTIELVQKTAPLKKRRWWAIVLTPDEDVVSFLRWQRQAIRELQAPLTLEAIPDLRERGDDDEAQVYEPIDNVEVGK